MRFTKEQEAAQDKVTNLADKKSTPVFSIIVPVFNAENHLEEYLDSILA